MHSVRQAASFTGRAGYVGGRHKGLAWCLSTWQNTKQHSLPQPQPGCQVGVSEVWGYCVEGKLENDQKERYLSVEAIGPSFCPPLLLSTVAHYIFCLIFKPQLVPVHWRMELEKGQTSRNSKGEMPARS